MGRRFQHLAQEGARFTLVNVAATVLALVLFNVLVHGVRGWFTGAMNTQPIPAYLVANTIGMVVSFLGARHFVYRQRKPTGPGGGAVNYAAVNLASFVIPVSCLWISRNLMHLDDALSDNISGNVVGAGLGTVFRFWAFRRFVFKVRKPAYRHGVPLNPHHLAFVGGFDSAAGASPEVGPDETELVEHQSQQRDADPDDVVGIPGHP